MNTLAAICLAAAVMAVACSASDMLDCGECVWAVRTSRQALMMITYTSELAANNGCDSFCEDWYKCVSGDCLDAGDKCQCYHCKDPQGGRDQHACMISFTSLKMAYVFSIPHRGDTS